MSGTVDPPEESHSDTECTHSHHKLHKGERVLTAKQDASLPSRMRGMKKPKK